MSSSHSRTHVLFLNICSRGVALARDAAAIFVFDSAALIDTYTGFVRIFFSNWVSLSEFSSMNWVYTIRRRGIEFIPVGDIFIILLLFGVIYFFLANEVLEFFLGSNFKDHLTDYLFVLWAILLLASGLFVALVSLIYRTSNAFASLIINITLVFVIFCLFYFGYNSHSYWFFLLIYVPTCIIFFLYSWVIWKCRMNFSFVLNFSLINQFSFFMNVIQSISQQIGPLLAHNAALAVSGLAASLYFAERLVLLIPILILSLTLSHYMRDFSTAITNDNKFYAREIYKMQIKFNLMFGTMGIIAILILALSFLNLFYEVFPFLGQISDMQGLVFLLVMISISASCWLVEMVALRTLIIMNKQVVATIGSIGIAGITFFLALVLETFVHNLLYYVIALWCTPIILRTFLFTSIVHRLLVRKSD